MELATIKIKFYNLTLSQNYYRGHGTAGAHWYTYDRTQPHSRVANKYNGSPDALW